MKLRSLFIMLILFGTFVPALIIDPSPTSLFREILDVGWMSRINSKPSDTACWTKPCLLVVPSEQIALFVFASSPASSIQVTGRPSIGCLHFERSRFSIKPVTSKLSVSSSRSSTSGAKRLVPRITTFCFSFGAMI